MELDDEIIAFLTSFKRLLLVKILRIVAVLSMAFLMLSLWELKITFHLDTVQKSILIGACCGMIILSYSIEERIKSTMIKIRLMEEISLYKRYNPIFKTYMRIVRGRETWEGQ